VFLKFAELKATSLRSRRQHKAWGMSPRRELNSNSKPAKAGDSGNANLLIYVFHEPAAENDRSVARFRGLVIVPAFALGFRCAPPQALCYRLLRRLNEFVCEL